MLGALSYTCPTDRSICYSVNSPSTNAAFQDLQTQINKFSSVAGFAPIAQDGLIGDATVSACKKAMAYGISHLGDSNTKANLIAMQPFVLSRQTLAPVAEEVGSTLMYAAMLLQLGPPSPGTTPHPTLPPSIPPVTIPPLVPAQSAFSTMTPTKKALIGVGASVGLGALVLFFWPKKKRSK